MGGTIHMDRMANIADRATTSVAAAACLLLALDARLLLGDIAR